MKKTTNKIIRKDQIKTGNNAAKNKEDKRFTSAWTQKLEMKKKMRLNKEMEEPNLDDSFGDIIYEIGNIKSRIQNVDLVFHLRRAIHHFYYYYYVF